MINNTVLRSVRYMLDLSDGQMVNLVKSTGLDVSIIEMKSWLKKEDDADYQECNDTSLLHFLNGLILFRRGQSENALPPVVESKITNNIILKKLRIAFELKDVDMLEIFTRVDFRLSKPELSAIFRKPGHKNYRECGDQILRNFLQGLTALLRVKTEAVENKSDKK